MDVEEREALRVFLAKVYGEQVNTWEMSERIFNLTYQLLERSAGCSDAMDYVPRPMPPGANPIKWVTKQARAILLRRLRDRKEYYYACVLAAAAGMKNEFLVAANGM